MKRQASKCSQCAYLDCEHIKMTEGSGWVYRCSKGRFDEPMPHSTVPIPTPIHFAWSGIKKPNKTVAKAQADCPFFDEKEK